jgi:hypothetical protein
MGTPGRVGPVAVIVLLGLLMALPLVPPPGTLPARAGAPGPAAPVRASMVLPSARPVSLAPAAEPPISFAIEVLVAPARCGNVTWQGTAAPNGTLLHVAAGNYSVDAGLCRGLSFEGWTVTGGIQLANATNATTVANVTGNGTIEARFEADLLLLTDPPGAGWIVLNGSEYGSASIAQLPVGRYSVSELAQPWARANGSLWLQGELSLSGGTLVVAGSGTITANFTLLARLKIEASGAPCSFLEVNATAVANGSVQSFPLNTTLTVSAGDCPSGRFLRWSPSGAITVLASNGSVLRVLVAGNGSLTALYRALYCLRLNVTPSAGGEVFLNGTQVGTTGCLELPAGTYPLTIEPGFGYAFDHTATSGAVSVASGALVVRGNGSLEVVFVQPTAPAGTPWWQQRGDQLAVVIVIVGIGGFLAALLLRRRPPRPPVEVFSPPRS